MRSREYRQTSKPKTCAINPILLYAPRCSLRQRLARIVLDVYDCPITQPAPRRRRQLSSIIGTHIPSDGAREGDPHRVGHTRVVWLYGSVGCARLPKHSRDVFPAIAGNVRRGRGADRAAAVLAIALRATKREKNEDGQREQ